MKEERDSKGRIVYKPIKGKPSRFPKGVSGNLLGRKKGTVNKFSVAELARAIKSVEYDKRQQFMIAWLESAWDNAGDMSKIVEFMIPKLRSIEGVLTTFDASMSDERAKNIQKDLRKRYK